MKRAQFAVVMILLSAMLVPGRGLAQYPPPEGDDIEASATVVAAGGTITVAGGGFRAASTVRVPLRCPGEEERELGSATANSAGRFSIRVTIPEDVSGTCVLQARGINPRGEPRVLSMTITVTSPRTGVEGVPLGIVLGAFAAAAVLGGGLVITRRRRGGRQAPAA